MCKAVAFSLLYLFSFMYAGEQAPELPQTVDIVYTWVDGADPAWQRLRQAAQASKSNWQQNSDADITCRYQDSEELRYSLRSVLKNIPNLGTIFIVTMNQRPTWLADHPRVKIVDHADIIDAKWLPTFNSQAIESAIHHISGLSEYFLYLNDDFFVAQPCKLEDFFLTNGALRFSVANSVGQDGELKDYYNSYRVALVNTNNLLNSLFGKQERRILAHAPQPLRVSWMYEAEQEFPEGFRANLASPFRDKSNYALTNGFLHHMWTERQRAEPNENNAILALYYSGVPLAPALNIRQLSRIQAFKPRFFCIEDQSVCRPAGSAQLLTSWLQEMFPEPAPWEL